MVLIILRNNFGILSRNHQVKSYVYHLGKIKVNKPLRRGDTISFSDSFLLLFFLQLSVNINMYPSEISRKLGFLMISGGIGVN